MEIEFRRKRILVVEDQSLVAETLASALEDDYDVSHCEDANRALLALESEQHVDAVLLDCLLPGGGYLRVIDRCDMLRVPVVLMSGDPERAEYFSSGKRDFLAKPFSLEALLEMMSRQVGDHAPPPGS